MKAIPQKATVMAPYGYGQKLSEWTLGNSVRASISYQGPESQLGYVIPLIKEPDCLSVFFLSFFIYICMTRILTQDHACIEN